MQLQKGQLNGGVELALLLAEVCRVYCMSSHPHL